MCEGKGDENSPLEPVVLTARLITRKELPCIEQKLVSLLRYVLSLRHASLYEI